MAKKEKNIPENEEYENTEAAEAADENDADNASGEPDEDIETVIVEDAEKSELDELKEKLAAQEDKYYRLAAEYDNYKKRTQREKDARYADALIDAAAGILPVVDNLERAMQVEVESEDAKKVLEGIAMVMKQLNDSFAKMNIKPIEALGKEFDPNLHNAVMHIEDDEYGENIVAEELMKGYIYKDERVVRHSMVKVAN
ncbi:MAG: nucleotide exchange factor GrpE [Oscillospiraceae bacterium]|nr:nucleotide exchange factor GrpE [Oscillospiraceae bacterium]